jgi:hypothetical protein
MELAQIEKIIRDRIDELRSLEKTEDKVRTPAKLRALISLQDKRDELESLLLRIRGMTLLNGTPPAPTCRHEKTFEQAWALKEAEGYQYGPDALEQVRFGWELAMGEADAEVPGA